MKTTFIYGLKDPLTKEIRYVGKSNNPRIRLSSHLRDKSKTYKVNWINKLKRKGLGPELVVLEEVEYDKWQEKEKFYIKYYENLTNYTEGGECGCEGYKHTEKTKRFFREERKRGFSKGDSHSKKTKDHLSKIRKEAGIGKDNSFYNKHHSKETLEVLSKKGKERWNNGIIKPPPVMIGKENPSAKRRVLINPKGKEFEVYSLRKFCNENNLSLELLKRSINRGIIQPPTDPKTIARQRYKSKNTIGWEIKED